MPGFPVPFIKFREVDANGFPLAGGKLYSYVTGTSSPLATYTTSALDVPNENPTILDGSGRASVYVRDGVGYKFVLNDKLNNLIWSEDGVMVPQVVPPPPPLVIPSGTIVAFGSTTTPIGWLLCDGASVSTTTYPDLFAAILYTFGGAGSAFNVPDLRQRFPLGKATAGTGVALGDTGGTIDHTHKAPHLGWGATTTIESGFTGWLLAAGTGVDSVDIVSNTDNRTGTGNPPYLAVNYLIKT